MPHTLGCGRAWRVADGGICPLTVPFAPTRRMARPARGQQVSSSLGSEAAWAEGGNTEKKRERERERKKERKREREREGEGREGERESETDRQRERQRDRETQAHRDRDTETQRVHPALVRYTKHSRTETLFVRWQKTVCPQSGRSRSEADRTGADRNQISPKWPGIPTGSPLYSGNQERNTGQEETAEVERQQPGRRREKTKSSSFGTGSRTEPEPSEPAAAVSDAVPLRAGQTNPIKARNRSPSTSPVHEAQSDRDTFCPMAENGLSAVRSQPQRGGPDRSRPEPDISEVARNSKDSSSFSLTTAVGRANEGNQGGRLEPDARSPSKGEGSGNKRS